MLTTTLMAMWKDWGFAPSLFAQAKEFLDLAKRSGTPEGYIRASIVFSLMSFEAYWGNVIRGYIQQKGNGIHNPAKLPEIQKALNNRFSIKTALETWPQLLVGEPLDTSTEFYENFDNFREYRNCLVHGKISEPIRSSWGKLAQDVETISDAGLAHQTVRKMVKVVALHFGYAIPTWAA